MNPRDLQYLVAVAEHRHFGRAANACFVSQAARVLRDADELVQLAEQAKRIYVT